MTGKEARRAAVDRLGGVEWSPKHHARGTFRINDTVHVEFDFKGFPKIKVHPKEVRKLLPPVQDLVPSLALWDEDMSSWVDVLLEARDRITSILEAREHAEPATPGEPRRRAIDDRMLRGLLDACKGNHPNESFFLLREDARGIIAEAIVAPGSKGGRVAAIFVPERLPFDRSIVASFHSHPNGNGHWSEQDLRAFIRYPVNIIAYYPYGTGDYIIYDSRGNQIDVDTRA